MVKITSSIFRYLVARLLLALSDKNAASIGVIGSVNGPTSILVARKHRPSVFRGRCHDNGTLEVSLDRNALLRAAAVSAAIVTLLTVLVAAIRSSHRRDRWL